MQPIQTDRLILRNFKAADASGLLEYTSEPRVNCFLEEKMNTLEEAAAEVQKRVNDDSHIAVSLQETDELIGELFLMQEEDESDTFNIGWNFNARYEGKGLARESAEALLEYLYTQKDARRLYAYVEDDNFRSQKLCEKLGMRQEGYMLEFVTFTNNADGTPKYENTYMYALLKWEWLKRKDNSRKKYVADSNSLVHSSQETRTLKCLTWNIKQGGGKTKLNDISAALISHDPHIIVLTEYRDNDSGSKLKSVLLEGGWQYQASSNPLKGKNGIWIASKIPFEQCHSFDYPLPEAEGRWIDLYMKDIDLSIIGVYIPVFDGKLDKENYWKSVISCAEKYVSSRCIIIGDFNTGLKEDTQGSPFELSEYIIQLQNLGWIDSWKSTHPNMNEFTWYSHSGNGFRLDYIYISPLLKNSLITSYHSHQERINKLSDHSILITEFII